MDMERKKILSVFRTYCDAYLEYVNNFITWARFVEFYELDETEAANLLKAREQMPTDMPWTAIDYFYNIVTNENYSEKSAIF